MMLQVVAGHTYQYALSLCAIFQDEAPYLKEWIEFHRLVGVEHFYLYNHRSSDSFQEVLKPYITSGIVELTDESTVADDNRSFNRLQSKCYTQCLQSARGVSKWVAFLDIDEFLFPVQEQSLVDFLKGYDAFGGVCANWLLFGTSDVKQIKPGDLLIETLTHCTAAAFRQNMYVKSIVRPERATHFLNPHHPEYCDDYFQVNTDRLPFEGPFCVYRQANKLRINHYWTRNEDYFFEKKIPRQKRWNGTPHAEALIQNMNAGEDTLILRYAPALKQAMQR